MGLHKYRHLTYARSTRDFSLVCDQARIPSFFFPKNFLSLILIHPRAYATAAGNTVCKHTRTRLVWIYYDLRIHAFLMSKQGAIMRINHFYLARPIFFSNSKSIEESDYSNDRLFYLLLARLLSQTI